MGSPLEAKEAARVASSTGGRGGGVEHGARGGRGEHNVGPAGQGDRGKFGGIGDLEATARPSWDEPNEARESAWARLIFFVSWIGGSA